MRKPVIKVENDKDQNTSSVLRAFSKRVSGAGIVMTARKGRYYARSLSELVKKKKALHRLANRKKNSLLLKLGKPLPIAKRGRRR